MQSKVIFRDRQELQAKDFNNLQTFAADTIKAVVNDGVTDERRFTGFATTATGATDLVVSPGRLYHQGTVYGRAAQTELSLFTYLPVATKRILALVAWGQVTETTTEPRDFLIDLTTGATEPQAVPMESRNQVEINIVSGVESADPVAPAVPDNTVIVALIVMGTTGVEEIRFQTDNQLPSTKENQRNIGDLQVWRGRIGPQIEAIQTNVAALEEKTNDRAERSAMLRMAGDIARLKERADLPDDYAYYGADQFINDDETDANAPGYDARISNGVEFPHEATAEAALQLFNPVDDRVTRSATDWLLPRYVDEAKIQVTGYSGDTSLSQYQVQTHAIREYTTYVQTWHAGYYTYSDYWYRHYGYLYYGLYSYYYNYHRTWHAGYYTSEPVTKYETVTTTTNYNGVVVGQTFLTPSAFWLTSVDLFLTQIGPSGDINVVICEADYGVPNLEKTLAHSVLQRSAMVRYPSQNRVQMPPVWLEAGKRYAVVLITEGSHRTAMVGGNDYTQGTWFYGNDGDYFTGDITKNLMFNVNGAVFLQPLTQIMLGNISLAGGITDLDIQTEAIVPKGTSLTYDIQVGGRWYPLESVEMLTQTPDIVPIRAIAVGTRDAAPGFQLAPQRVTASRPKLAVKHVSNLRTLPGAVTSDEITVTFLVSGYLEDEHTFSARLLDASNVSIASATATTFEAEHEDADETVTRITCVFDLDTPISQYKIEFSGTRVAGAGLFRVLERMDVAV